MPLTQVYIAQYFWLFILDAGKEGRKEGRSIIASIFNTGKAFGQYSNG